MLENLTPRKKYWLGIFGMVLIAAIAYLPLVSKIGYLNDDWYLMYDAYIGGAPIVPSPTVMTPMSWAAPPIASFADFT